MAIILRQFEGQMVALCAAKAKLRTTDVYLDDADHHALSVKFGYDFHSMGFLNDPHASEKDIDRMERAEVEDRQWQQ